MNQQDPFGQRSYSPRRYQLRSTYSDVPVFPGCQENRIIEINQKVIGGADGNRTRVQNTYLLKLFLRNRLIFTESVLVKRWVHSNRSSVTFGNVKVYTLQSSTTYFLGKQENHRMRHHLFLRLKQETIIQYSSGKLTE